MAKLLGQEIVTHEEFNQHKADNQLKMDMIVASVCTRMEDAEKLVSSLENKLILAYTAAGISAIAAIAAIVSVLMH